MSAPRETGPGHDRHADQLLAFAAGMLDEAAAEAFEAHARECAACREDLQALRSKAVDEGGAHLPNTLIATWPRSSAKLGGLERELVSRHLARCEKCRAKLELLGYEAVLGVPAKAASERAVREAPRKIVEFPRERRMLQWLVGPGVLAAAAAIALVVTRTPVLTELETLVASRPPATQTPTPAPGGATTPTPGGTNPALPGGTPAPSPGGTPPPTPSPGPTAPAGGGGLLAVGASTRPLLLTFGFAERGAGAPEALPRVAAESLSVAALEVPTDVLEAGLMISPDAVLEVHMEQAGRPVAKFSRSVREIRAQHLALAIQPGVLHEGEVVVRFDVRKLGELAARPVRIVRFVVGAAPKP